MTDGPVLITGFHRSGTSAVARAMHHAGLDLGTDLLGAEDANPYGHFEDERVIAVHDAILEAEQLSWKSLSVVQDRTSARAQIAAYASTRTDEAGGSTWGVKDPRMCLFLSEWVAACPSAKIVFVLRAPGPAIDSLHRRHIKRHVDTGDVDPSDLDFWRVPDLGLRLWLHYHRNALPILQNQPAHIVTFDDHDRVDAQLSALCDALSLGGTTAPLDRSLGRPNTVPVVATKHISEAEDLWAELIALASPR